MSSDDRKTPAPPVLTLVPAETVGPDDALAPGRAAPLVLAVPETLVDGLRYLQERIPGFTQLSVREKRSHARAANLDPEFIECGLHAADVWRDTETVVKRSGKELREEQEEIRRWDQVVVELRAITAGIEAANLKRKHHLGSAILMIYRILGICIDRGLAQDDYMRPYYENMKRAYLRTQQFRKRKKKEEEP